MLSVEKLRLDSGIKKIEVNDDGEYISINLSDNTFFDRFNKFINWFDEKQVEVDKKSKELAEKYSKESEAGENEEKDLNFEKITDLTSLYKDICDDVSKQMDNLFGDNCLRKVFPDVQSPGFELIIDFLDAIAPILKKYAQERNEKINLKYNRSRKGARS